MIIKGYDSRIKFLLKKLATYSELGVAKKTIKASRLVLEEMSTKKGFKRHDGRDYFVHPFALTQTAIDFRLANFCTGSNLSKEDKEMNKESDALLSACLLHDIIEDVEWIDKDYIIKEFGEYIYNIVDNVTKRDGEDIEQYLDRVAKLRLSSLVKIIDRLNNVSTLNNSSLNHRKKQLEETRKYYLPLAKQLRTIYFEDASFYWQARTIMNSILNEVEIAIKYEDKCIELEKQIENMKSKMPTDK